MFINYLISYRLIFIKHGLNRKISLLSHAELSKRAARPERATGF